MSGSTNFLQFNPLKNNQLDDAGYTADSMRSNGAANGSVCPANSFNKLAYQTSIFTAAFAQMMANKGYAVSDADFSALVAVLANISTPADAPVRRLSHQQITGRTLYASGWTAIPASDSAPLQTQGVQIFSQVLTAPANVSVLALRGTIYASPAASVHLWATIWKDSTLLGVAGGNLVGGSQNGVPLVVDIEIPADASAHTYSVRIGGETTCDLYLNGYLGYGMGNNAISSFTIDGY